MVIAVIREPGFLYLSAYHLSVHRPWFILQLGLQSIISAFQAAG